MRQKTFVALASFLALLIVAPLAAYASGQLSPGTYYVDINQASEGEGTEISPWKTLHYAIGQINEGSLGIYTLNVAVGTYSSANGEADQDLAITQNNVSVIGETGSMPLLDGTGASSWYRGIGIEASNVIVKNLEVTGFADEADVGIKIYGGSSNTIQDCSIYGNWDGVVIYQSTDCTINACEIYANTYDGISIGDSSSTGITITENIIHDHTNSDGIAIAGCSPVIKRNTLYDNKYQISVVGYSSETPSPTVQNNLIYETLGSTVFSYGIIIAAYDSSDISPKIYHNTIDAGTYDGIVIERYGMGTSSPEIKYNIITNFDQYGIIDQGGGYGGSPTIDYNDVWHNGPDPYNQNYSGCTKGENDISQDPLYGSYELQSGSPCIDAIPTAADDPVTVDFEGTSRPKGSGYDMGAYEYVSQYGLTVTTAGQGTVTLYPAGGTYDEDTVVALTAAADSGWVFNGWSGDLTGSTNPENITMNSNKSVTATFVEADSDGDGMLDAWEYTYFGDLTHDGTADGDSDGLTYL